MADPSELSPIEWRGDHLALLDQTLLPGEERWLACRDPEAVAVAIRRLAVRGAPAIGVAAAYGLALALRGAAADDDPQRAFEEGYDRLAATRPTAVNLRWALEQGRAVFAAERRRGAADLAAALLALARRIQDDDVAANRRMAAHGASLLAPGARILTHCNTGALATAGIGTALGVVVEAHRQGRVAQVWVDETRPLLQGARLTAWELGRAGVAHRVVTDSMVGALMARGAVDAAIVGADRIAANGDVANKIGTYTVAVLARRHGVPFYVVAPRSTIDPGAADGAAIPIEERDGEEVTHLAGTRIAPPATAGFNWAFDVTPAELVTAIVTEAGVLEPPFAAAIARVLARARA